MTADSKKTIHKLISFVLSVYLSFVLYLGPKILGISDYETSFSKDIIIFCLLPVAFYKVLLFLSSKFNNIELKLGGNNRNLISYFLLGFVSSFVLYEVILMISYPGSINQDNIDQLRQITSHKFADWHPYLHTLVLWAIYQIHNSYGFIIFAQIFIFSLACGYLILTLAKHGFPRWGILLSLLYIILNPQNQQLMLFATKDHGVTIGMLCLVSMMINIIFSNGLWIKKQKNLIAFACCVTLITFFRHNAIFLTFPILILAPLIFTAVRKQMLISIGICFVMMCYLKFILPSQLNVIRTSGQEYGECLGIPLTTILNVRKLSPNKLNEEADLFLDQFTNQEFFERNYRLGSYNSIKWERETIEAVSKTNLRQVLNIFYTTIENAPLESIQAIAQLTRIVWDIRGNINLLMGSYIHENGLGIVRSKRFEESFNKLTRIQIDFNLSIHYFFNLGFLILILILFSYFSYPARGGQIFWLVIPILLHNFGTMLLLSGEDLRYFNFNYHTTIPICLTAFAISKTNRIGNVNPSI